MAEPGFTNVGVSFDGHAPIATIGDQARRAEEGGAATLWIACHLFLRDPVTTAALALSATTRIKVALMAMSPYSVHPVFAAMAAATLDEMFPGRVILCLGVGAPADLAAAGIASPKPLQTLGEAIALSRALLDGAPVRHRGEIFQVADRRLINGAGRVPIMLAASGPQMLALAGRAADGVLISAATSVKFVRWCLDHVERGAAGRKLAKCAIVYTSVAATPMTGCAARSASCCAARITRATWRWPARCSTRPRWPPPTRRRTGKRSTGWSTIRCCATTPPAARRTRCALPTRPITRSVSTR